MELKYFIKGVISDITNAVKECQDELDNGSIVSPMNYQSPEFFRGKDGDMKISYIDFDVSVTASEETSAKEGVNGGIKGGISVCGFKVGSKVSSTSEDNSKQSNENVSKIHFSIPVCYPTATYVKERPKRNKANLRRIF